MSEAQAAPEVTGKMFLYEQPELLMKEKHGDLALAPVEKPFGFAAKARASPQRKTGSAWPSSSTAPLRG